MVFKGVVYDARCSTTGVHKRLAHVRREGGEVVVIMMGILGGLGLI